MKRNLSRRGAEAVEFALVLPVLIVILAGTFDYGWYFHQQMVLQDATREGARTGAVTPQDGDAIAAATAAFDQALEEGGQGNLGPAVTAELITASNGEQAVRVDAVAEYDGLWNLVALPYELHATVVMRREDQPQE